MQKNSAVAKLLSYYKLCSWPKEQEEEVSFLSRAKVHRRVGGSVIKQQKVMWLGIWAF